MMWQYVKNLHSLNVWRKSKRIHLLNPFSEMSQTVSFFTDWFCLYTLFHLYKYPDLRDCILPDCSESWIRLCIYLLGCFFKVRARLMSLTWLLVITRLEIFLSVFSLLLSTLCNMSGSKCMSAEKQVATITLLNKGGLLTLDEWGCRTVLWIVECSCPCSVQNRFA